MPRTTFERTLTLSGIVAGVAFLAANLLTLTEPKLDYNNPQAYIHWAAAHRTNLTATGICGAYFALFMLLFTVALRFSLRAGEAAESTYSSVAFAGGIGVALSIATASALSISVADAHRFPDAVRTLSFVADLAWIPWAASTGALLLGVGLGGLRTLALPRWFAILSLVLAALSVTGPTGIAVFMLFPLWLIATAVILRRRQHAPEQATDHQPLSRV